MRSKNLILFLAVFSFLFFITSCEKETEEFKTEAIADYLPLAVGKYINYRLDSTVFTNFGRNEEIHSRPARAAHSGDRRARARRRSATAGVILIT